MKDSQANPMPRIPWETAVLGCGARRGREGRGGGGAGAGWKQVGLRAAQLETEALGPEMGSAPWAGSGAGWSFLTCVSQCRLAQAGKQN